MRKWKAVVDPSLTSTECECDQFSAVLVTDKNQVSKILKSLSQSFPLHERYSHLKRVDRVDSSFWILIGPHGELPGIDMPEIKDLEKTSVSVPRFKPITHAQYLVYHEIWPCTYRKDNYIETLISDNFFSDSETTEIEKRIPAPGSCLIVDPKSQKTLGSGKDSDAHPLHHCVINALSAVADNPDQPKSAYLCSGYDCYVYLEPCVMCSMALLHSRIRRVFYVQSNPKGGLGSIYSLHFCKQLNHHFEVFRCE